MGMMKFLKTHVPKVMSLSKLALSVLMLLLFYTPNQLVYSQTPPAQKVESLFSDDTCAPPCWFGLTVGQSTVDDAIRMFEAHKDVFYTKLIEGHDHVYRPVLDLQPLVEGHELGFLWLHGEQADAPLGISGIEVTDGVVSNIFVLPKEAISLGPTLKKLGKPSSVRVTYSLYVDYLYLYYRDMYLIVDLFVKHDACSKGILDEFTVDTVHYLTEEGYSNQQTADNKQLVYVPARIWDAWKQKKSDTLGCLDILDKPVK